MPIIFDNSADLTNVSVPPITVGTPQIIQLVAGGTLNIYRDGVRVAELVKPLDTYRADALGEYTFVIPEGCTKRTIVDAAELFDSVNGTVALLDAVDTVACGDSSELITVDSDITELGPLPDSLPATPPGFTFENIIDAATGSPFSEFPYEFQPAPTGNGVGAFSPPAIDSVVDECDDITVQSIEFTLDHTQLTDSDPAANDPSDMTVWVELNGVPVPSSVSISSGTTTPSAFPEGTGTTRPLNQEVTITASLDNASQYSLDDASNMILVSTFQSQDIFIVSGAERSVSYLRADSCLPRSLSTRDCNSDAILQALLDINTSVGSGPDYTAILTAIQTEVSEINAETDELAPIAASVANLEILAGTGNVSLTQIIAALNDILTQAQGIQANTDSLESLVLTLTTTLQSESDETQVILDDILLAVSSQSLILEDVCATVDGTPTKVIPVAIYNPILGSFAPPLYIDDMGIEITGVVAEADPCDCDCLECPLEFETLFSLQTTSDDSNNTSTEERGITFTPDEDTILQSITLPLNQQSGTPLSTGIGVEIRVGATPYGAASESSTNVVDIPQNPELRQFSFDDVLLNAGQTYTFTVSDQNSGIQFQVSDNNVDNFPQVGNVDGLTESAIDSIILIEGLRA